MIGHALPVYRGYVSQYGYGLGNVLGGLVRSALPMIGNIAKSAGAKLLQTGLDAAGEALIKRTHSKVSKKRKTTQTHKSNKKRKFHHAKRSTSHSKTVHKRKTPPGQSVSRAVKAKARKPRDIFAK